ncbi:MAG: hypothetical protein R3Y09_04145 [Clostridia bacterium]
MKKYVKSLIIALFSVSVLYFSSVLVSNIINGTQVNAIIIITQILHNFGVPNSICTFIIYAMPVYFLGLASFVMMIFTEREQILLSKKGKIGLILISAIPIVIYLGIAMYNFSLLGFCFDELNAGLAFSGLAFSLGFFSESKS